jgi:hypothetical protein
VSVKTGAAFLFPDTKKIIKIFKLYIMETIQVKRRRNVEKICSSTQNGELKRNQYAKKYTETAWERAVRWANNNPRTINV